MKQCSLTKYGDNAHAIRAVYNEGARYIRQTVVSPCKSLFADNLIGRAHISFVATGNDVLRARVYKRQQRSRSSSGSSDGSIGVRRRTQPASPWSPGLGSPPQARRRSSTSTCHRDRAAIPARPDLTGGPRAEPTDRLLTWSSGAATPVGSTE